MYLAVTITLLRYRVFEPLRVNWRHRLRVLDVYPESPDTVSVCLCGPPGMTASVRRALHEPGVDDADIHEEAFTFYQSSFWPSGCGQAGASTQVAQVLDNHT